MGMTFFFPAKEVAPRLWVGSSADSRNKAFLKKHDIGLVVNATRTIPFSSRHILGYRVPVDDHTDENETMLEYFPITSRIIDEALKSGQGVLVHCYAGIQRSCAVAAAYLMHSTGCSAKDAMAKIQDKKSEAFQPVPTFGRALSRFGRDR
jgi:protein-tyrosine phosphatase